MAGNACAVDATTPVYLDLFHNVSLKRRIRPARLLPEEKCHAQCNRGFFHYHWESVLGLSGLLMLNYFFPSAEGCAAGAKLLFQILASLGAIVVVAVLIQHADQIAPGAWAFVASSPPPS